MQRCQMYLLASGSVPDRDCEIRSWRANACATTRQTGSRNDSDEEHDKQHRRNQSRDEKAAKRGAQKPRSLAHRDDGRLARALLRH